MNKWTILFCSLPLFLTFAYADLSKEQRRIEIDAVVEDFVSTHEVHKKYVNLSGRQRMLTQRISKLALLMAVNPEMNGSKERLTQYATLYDETLKAFREGDEKLGFRPATSTTILEQITKVEEAWKPFHAHVQQIIDGHDQNQSALQYIITHNEALLTLSNDLVQAFESEHQSDNYLENAMLRVVNVAGRQRMLSQKMTKEKLMVVKGEAAYQEKLTKTIQLFDASLTMLMEGDPKGSIVKPTDKAIKEQLTKVDGLWQELKPLYNKENVDSKELAVIIQKNPVLLAEMHKMVNMAETVTDY
ncbi:MAG TPA: hypothetical protein ENK86_03205 [Campylobacterales bacterium]|nr:hypothetical protein [Campylobacterales bacterium]